jgi:hypothetical protein
LVISANFLIDAPAGPSEYYPLLDSSRVINDMTLPPEVQLVVVIQKREFAAFREDFRDRFQLRGEIDPEILPALKASFEAEGVNEVKAETQPISICPKEVDEYGEESALFGLAVPVDRHNFHELFRHKAIAPTGLIFSPGWLAEFKTARVAVADDLTPDQWAALSQSGQVERVYVKSHIKLPAPLSLCRGVLGNDGVRAYQNVFLIRSIHRSHLPSRLFGDQFSFALPEMGSPFVRNRQTPEGVKAFLTGLVDLLRVDHQKVILYGKLSPFLRAQLRTLTTGFCLLAGSLVKVGERSQWQVLEINDRANTACGRAEGPMSPYCRVQEGPVDISRLDSFENRLNAWVDNLRSSKEGEEGGVSQSLTVTSFDLMNPKTSGQARHLVLSALGGHVMVEGVIYRCKTSCPIHVIGTGIPSSIRKMAQAFGVYESMAAPSPSFRGEESDTYRLPLPSDETFTASGLIPTDSRKDLLVVLKTWLEANDASQPVFLVEGPSGVGKTSTIKAYFKEMAWDRFEVLLPSKHLIQQIGEANQAGKVVLIDELNTLSLKQLRAIVALVQSQPRLRIVATQNPISFKGRVRLPKGIIERSRCVFLDNYSEADLQKMCAFKSIPRALQSPFIERYQELSRANKSTPRNFIAAVFSVSEVMARSRCEEVAVALHGTDVEP